MNLFVIIIYLLYFNKMIIANNFSIVILPDTQYYSAWWMEIFDEQTQWICSNKENFNIIFVSHLGDIVEHENTDESEWIAAKQSMNILNKCNITNSVLTGNHDSTNYKNNVTYKYFLKYFPLEKKEISFTNSSIIEKLNTFNIIENNEKKFLFISLQYIFDAYNNGDIFDLLKWVENVIEYFYNNIDGIFLSTHFASSDRGNYIQYDIKNLILKYCKIIAVFNGHEFNSGGENTVQIKNNCNQNRFVFVSDYQKRNRGGNGFLRLYNFNQNDLCVFTFSPLLNEYELDDNSHFSITNLLNNNNQTININSGCSIQTALASGYASNGYIFGSLSITITLIFSLLLLFIIEIRSFLYYNIYYDYLYQKRKKKLNS